jgi:UDP-N-acetylmuramoyl-L-alanyl-D-glutamate--2,6-diaminopimelate ligase
MKLKKLLKEIPKIQVKGSKSIEISGLSSHSKRVFPGNLFIVKKGKKYDGHQYIEEAINGGAIAILTDLYDPFFPKLTQLIYPDIQEIEGTLAHLFYEKPSLELFTIGITGTNGKTTTAYLIKHLLDSLNQLTGLLGSIEYLTGTHRYQSTHTTPNAIDNHKYLKEMLTNKCVNAVLEVTSHGIDQKRTNGIEFDIAIFTNLSQDHLDYHNTMEEYASVKQKLFSSLNSDQYAIINNDDPWSSYYSKASPHTITYGINKQSDVMAKSIKVTPQGTQCTLLYKEEEVSFYWPLIGEFNIYNCLAALSVGVYLGKTLKETAHKLSSFKPIPGRLQSVTNTNNLHIFIDFAHTDDALKNSLKCLQEIKQKKIITVFGCGGNRDQSKRPKMAHIAEYYSDYVIVTSDNPRSEDPENICQDIIKGFKSIESYCIEIDRRKAIEKAIELGQEDDIILIAGKGHETHQIFSHRTIEFDDFLIAQEIYQKQYV